jgi:hypothetical protein
MMDVEVRYANLKKKARQSPKWARRIFLLQTRQDILEVGKANPGEAGKAKLWLGESTGSGQGEADAWRIRSLGQGESSSSGQGESLGVGQGEA